MKQPRLTFADLVKIFLVSQSAPTKSQADFARDVQVSLGTLNKWLNGRSVPRSQNDVLVVSKYLELNDVQADLLLNAVNPGWVMYGTPKRVLDAYEPFRYRELSETVAVTARSMPSVAEIERSWPIHWEDHFESNFKRWGCGTKDANIARVQREIRKGRFHLQVTSKYHESVMFGGDSSCIAPENYYLSVMAERVKGDGDDGCGVFFNEICDDAFALFRIREKSRQISVVSTVSGTDEYTIHLNRTACPHINPGRPNKLAILAIGNQHWFFVNDIESAFVIVERPSHGRLDVAAVVAEPRKAVDCAFSEFIVRVPSVERSGRDRRVMLP